MHRVALVEAFVVAQQALAVRRVLVGAQHGAGKTTALHLQQLVNQHVAVGADVTREAATAQHKRLAEGAAIGELGKVQVNARHALKGYVVRVGIVGQHEARRLVGMGRRSDELQCHGVCALQIRPWRARWRGGRHWQRF